MSRTRYEPVPQRDESISLDSITGYNYNSGVPNSLPSSAAPSYYGDNAAPSIRSIPASPPPSFHTHSSPGTPRPAPSTTAQSIHSAHALRNGESDYAELWGVAASTTGAPTEACAGSEALATITHLQTRIAQLEETIGRLLLEKDAAQPKEYKGGNCCMSFVDADPSLEHGMSSSGGNCCIYFNSSKVDKAQQEREQRIWVGLAWLFVAFVICGTIVLTTYAKNH